MKRSLQTCQDSERHSDVNEMTYNNLNSVDESPIFGMPQNPSNSQLFLENYHNHSYHNTTTGQSENSSPSHQTDLNYCQKDQEDIGMYLNSEFNKPKPEACTKKTEKNQNQQKTSKQYSKEHRQRKKQYVKNLEEENMFLRHKIQELHLRLNEADNELRKIKYSYQSTDKNGKTTNLSYSEKNKEEFIEYVEEKFSKKEQLSLQQLQSIEAKINEFVSMDGKQKVDKVNFHMMEVFQNIIPDEPCFFLQGLLHQKGVWNPDPNSQLRKIDRELLEVLTLDTEQKVNFLRSIVPESLRDSCLKFKELCQRLFQCYEQICVHSTIVRGHIDQVIRKLKSRFSPVIMIDEFLYFCKIKYRKDLRQIRQDWMLGIMSKNDLSSRQALSSL